MKNLQKLFFHSRLTISEFNIHSKKNKDLLRIHFHIQLFVKSHFEVNDGT